MKQVVMNFLLAGALAGLSSGCAVFEPAYPQSVSKAAADGLKGVSELVASAQLGDFSSIGSYEKAAPRYASALANLELARGWAVARSSGDQRIPATKATRIMSAHPPRRGRADSV